MPDLTLNQFVWISGSIFWALMNGLTYLVFALDKEQARAKSWRVSESTLLALAFFGGSIGAKLAQRRLRHKTRKHPFGLILNAICLLQMGLIIAVILMVVAPQPS